MEVREVRANVLEVWAKLAVGAAGIIIISSIVQKIPLAKATSSWSFVIFIAIIGGIFMSLNYRRIYLCLDGQKLVARNGFLTREYRIPVKDITSITKGRRGGAAGGFSDSSSWTGKPHNQLIKIETLTGEVVIVNATFFNREAVNDLISETHKLNPDMKVDMDDLQFI